MVSVPALALGLVLAGWQWGGAAWIYGKAELAQVLMERAWSATPAGGAAPRPWPWADFHPVARLTVPALGVKRMVLSDATLRTLAFGPGVLTSSAPVGSPGTTVLAGHRDTHFAFLKRLKPGMEITLDTGGRTVRYRVVGTRVMDTRKDRLTLDGGEDDLVLVTCWPFDAIVPGGPLRYLVIAERIRLDGMLSL